MRVPFPNYENFDSPDIAYVDFISRLNCAINTLAPFKTVGVKYNSSKWFDGEIARNIHTLDKMLKRIKLTRLHADKEIYKEMLNPVETQLFSNKEKTLL